MSTMAIPFDLNVIRLAIEMAMEPAFRVLWICFIDCHSSFIVAKTSNIDTSSIVPFLSPYCYAILTGLISMLCSYRSHIFLVSALIPIYKKKGQFKSIWCFSGSLFAAATCILLDDTLSIWRQKTWYESFSTFSLEYDVVYENTGCNSKR